MIENGVKESNKTKERIFTSTNRKLGKLSYKKGGKVRIYYKSLPDNGVYVIFVNIIKSNKDKKKLQDVITRIGNVSKEYSELKKLFKSTDVKDIERKNQIIEENLEYRDQIYEYLGEEPPVRVDGHGRK